MNKNSQNTSRRVTDNDEGWLMLRDDHGNLYRYRNPNIKDDLKMSYVEGQETVVLLPPGTLQQSVTSPTNKTSYGNRKREEQQPSSTVPDSKKTKSKMSSSSVITDSNTTETSENPKTTTHQRIIAKQNSNKSESVFKQKNTARENESKLDRDSSNRPDAAALLARKSPRMLVKTAEDAENRVYPTNDREKSNDLTMVSKPIRKSELEPYGQDSGERDRYSSTEHTVLTDNGTGDDFGDLPILSKINPINNYYSHSAPSDCDERTYHDDKPAATTTTIDIPDCDTADSKEHHDYDNENPSDKPREICIDSDNDDLTLLVENNIKLKVVSNSKRRFPSFKEENKRGGKSAPEISRKDNNRPSTIDCDSTEIYNS